MAAEEWQGQLFVLRWISSRVVFAMPALHGLACPARMAEYCKGIL
jgi:hypothetical protein